MYSAAVLPARLAISLIFAVLGNHLSRGLAPLGGMAALALAAGLVHDLAGNPEVVGRQVSQLGDGLARFVHVRYVLGRGGRVLDLLLPKGPGVLSGSTPSSPFGKRVLQ